MGERRGVYKEIGRNMEMDISVFEVIGPVMVGPSSSGTAGMARLGWAAGRFLDGPVKKIHLAFHPRLQDYAGLRSHVALVGGVLGMREYDPNLKHALDIARERGIQLTAGKLKPPLPDALVVKLYMEQESGVVRTVEGISVGGGSISITAIDDFPVELISTEKYLFVWADANVSEAILRMMPPETELKKSEKEGKSLFYMGVSPQLKEEPVKEGLQKIPGVTKALFTEPFLSFGYRPYQPLFTTFADLMRLTDETGKDIPELAIEYEMDRSGRTRQEIWDEMKASLDYMRESVQTGLEEELHTLFGFGTGADGKKMMKALAEGRTLSGSTMSRAFAKALATMEMDCSMNRIVAAPTGGSAGIVPGCILTIQEDRGCSDEELVKSLFVAAAAGICMYYQNANFSGMRGGCQGEIGVSSAIAAAALAYLGGGDTKTICHAMALSMKNLLGLICDRIGGSSEIPCIRRNCVGVANAFAGCDMALAGITSYISPDEVIAALCNTQKLLPAALRGGYGGLGCTLGAKHAREIEAKINQSLRLPEVDTIDSEEHA